MLKIFGLGNSSTGSKKHGSTSSGKARSGKARSEKARSEKEEEKIAMDDMNPKEKSQDNDIVAVLQQQVLELKLANEKLASSLLANPPPREFFWVIHDFKWAQRLWVSEPLSFCDRIFALNFGPTESGDFGFILTLVTPTSSEFKLCAKFRMHHRFNVPYERTRPEPMTFSPMSMRSRGFVSFASVDVISSHLDSRSGSLKLSVVLSSVRGGDGERSARQHDQV